MPILCVAALSHRLQPGPNIRREYFARCMARYSLGELVDSIERADLRVVRATYANTLLLPIAAVRRLVLRRVGLAAGGSDVRPLPPRLRPARASPERAALLPSAQERARARWS